MKDVLICFLATAWVGLVIYQISRRPVQAVYRRPYPRAHDEHGAGGYTQQAIDQANRAHTGGHVHCPIHGAACGRANAARETGMSQTDEDIGRRALNGTR